MNTVKVGLIGYGFSGRTFHAPLLKDLDEFDITKVLSSKPELVKQDIGKAEVVSGINEIVEDPEIELVVITTPNTFHYEMAKQSILHRKHVVIEKPMVIEQEEAKELIELAKKQQVMLSVYHNRRWDNDFLTIKQVIENGELGKVMSYKAHFDRFRPHVRKRWREQKGRGSGMLYDLGSHLIDQALHLFGSPNFVMADVLAQRDEGETDDYFHIILGYERLRVMLHSSSFVKSAGPKFEVHGTKGSFIKYGSDSQEAALKKGELPSDKKEWGVDKPEHYGRLIQEKAGEDVERIVETVPGYYPAYYKQVYQHIRNNQPVPVSAEDGLRTIELIEAAFRSSQEKRAVYL
ncbi:oxidoreductase [Bacillus tianshenii]|nr:oxidoreductase [Bacillus tianshenii]